MNRSRFLFLGLLLTLLGACSDDSTSPEVNNNNNSGGGSGDGNFTIVSVNRYTVYWGDTVILVLSNAQTNSFQLFVHTVPITIDSVWRVDSSGSASLRFRIPEKLSSGKIRVFERDSVEAKGDRSFIVIPQLRSSIQPEFYTIFPGDAHIGDAFTIKGKNFPLNREDVEVMIGNIIAPLIHVDTEVIAVRVSEGSQSGRVQVRIFDKRYNAGTMKILEPQTVAFGQHPLTGFDMYVSSLHGAFQKNTFKQNDTSTTVEPGFITYINAGYMFDPTEPSVSDSAASDSVVYDTGLPEGTGDRVEVRLRLEPGNRASGMIRLEHVWTSGVLFHEFHIRNMRYSKDGVMYQLRAFSVDLNDQLVSYSSGTIYRSSSEIFSFERADALSAIILTIRQQE